MDGNGKRSSVPPRKAVIATRDKRSIRVNDFSGPIGPVADGRIQVITLRAPNVEPMERPPQMPPLLCRRLYLVRSRERAQSQELSQFWFQWPFRLRLPARRPSGRIGIDQSPFF